MGTDNGNDLNGEQPRVTAPGSLSVDVDMDPELTRIMSATQEATEAVRQSFEAASRAREETIAQGQAEAEVVLADARTEADRLVAEGKDETEARLKEAEKQAARHLAQAAEQAEGLLRDARAEHAKLSEVVPRLRAAVGEIEAFIEAFRHATRRFEEATGHMMISGETDTSPLASNEDDDGTGARQPISDLPLETGGESKQAAIEALSSLSI